MLYQDLGIRDSSSTNLVCRGSDGAIGNLLFLDAAGSGSLARGCGGRNRGARSPAARSERVRPGDALEEDEPVRSGAHVDAGCRLGEPPSNVGAGRDPVRARQGQVRPEQTLVGRPASRNQLAVDGGRERCELPCSVRDRQSTTSRPAWVRENEATASILDLEGVLSRRARPDRLGDRALHVPARLGPRKRA
jgi:hypothetical protein